MREKFQVPFPALLLVHTVLKCVYLVGKCVLAGHNVLDLLVGLNEDGFEEVHETSSHIL